MLEARTAVSGATGRNGGHLVSDNDSLFSALVSTVGLERAIETVHFSEANIRRLKDLIAQLLDAEREAVEFRTVTTTTSFEDRHSFKDAVKTMEELTNAVPDGDLKYRVSSAAEASQVSKYIASPHKIHLNKPNL
jgi:hypothetical protein